MVSGFSSSPELNPLSIFIRSDTASAAIDGGSKTSFELDAGDLLPDQPPSIINESATVRYYQDGTRRPAIVSDGHQGNAEELSDGQGACYDVMLSLDVSTGCGGKIWPAAEVLGQYIASQRSDSQWKGKCAVELGTGTGLVGFLAAQATELDAIWITDQQPMLALMERNLQLNPQLAKKYCVYLEIAFAPLVETMCEMATEQTEILFCYQQRRKADKRFFKLLRKHFTFYDIEDDDKARQLEYNRQGTRLYRVCKRIK